MTSKEAIDILESECKALNDEWAFSPKQVEKGISSMDARALEVIKQDLEVLEILKRHLVVETDYCGDSEFKTHTTISLYWDNQKLSVDSKEGKEHKLVKEWLERKENKNE